MARVDQDEVEPEFLRRDYGARPPVAVAFCPFAVVPQEPRPQPQHYLARCQCDGVMRNAGNPILQRLDWVTKEEIPRAVDT